LPTDIDYRAVDSVVLPDGKILTAGSVRIPQTGSAPIEAVMVTRFNPNGTPDTTFGESGQSTKIVNGNQDESLRAIDLAVQSDGKIILAFGTNFTTRLTRYNTDGTFDTTFGGSLRQNNSVAISGAGFGGTQSLLISPDNKIIVGTSSDGKFQDISGSIGVTAGVTNTYTDVGGATNTPTRFYRVRVVP